MPDCMLQPPKQIKKCCIFKSVTNGTANIVGTNIHVIDAEHAEVECWSEFNDIYILML
jgi:hypothetical protein